MKKSIDSFLWSADVHICHPVVKTSWGLTYILIYIQPTGAGCLEAVPQVVCNSPTAFSAVIAVNVK